MNKIFNVIMLLTCLFMTACSGHNEPDAITPIHFEQRDYTIMFGKGAVIPFTGGSGVYELTASNPEVLGRFGIEMEAPNHSLYIQPAKTGESYLIIKDVKTEATVTLHFIVEDFYLSFRIYEVDATNTNEFFEVGREIRFIRNEDNTKPVKVVSYQNNTSRPMTVGEGLFNITRSDTNIFTMEFSLHSSMGEDSKLYDYEYTMGGDGEYMRMFDSIFNFGWEKNVASLSSKSQPVKSIEMILTDKNNDCKITCSLLK
ncbi:MAG: hypothetical protein Q4C37_01980 [Bacteroidales bacterium]|nr:hypothetical protein [Bacteroidales bacterium]